MNKMDKLNQELFEAPPVSDQVQRLTKMAQLGYGEYWRTSKPVETALSKFRGLQGDYPGSQQTKTDNNAFGLAYVESHRLPKEVEVPAEKSESTSLLSRIVDLTSTTGQRALSTGRALAEGTKNVDEGIERAVAGVGLKFAESKNDDMRKAVTEAFRASLSKEEKEKLSKELEEKYKEELKPDTLVEKAKDFVGLGDDAIDHEVAARWDRYVQAIRRGEAEAPELSFAGKSLDVFAGYELFKKMEAWENSVDLSQHTPEANAKKEQLTGFNSKQEFLRYDLADKMAGWAKDAKERMSANPYEYGTPEYFAFTFGGSAPQMLAAATASAVTRNPYLGASIIAAPVFGEVYAEGRERGLGDDDAFNYAIATAISEFLPQATVFKYLDKAGGGSFLKKILKGTIAEGAEEVVTEALQMGLELGFIGEDDSGLEWWQRLVTAGVVGAAGGLTIGTVYHAADKYSAGNVDRAHRDDIDNKVKNYVQMARQILNNQQAEQPAQQQAEQPARQPAQQQAEQPAQPQPAQPTARPAQPQPQPQPAQPQPTQQPAREFTQEDIEYIASNVSIDDANKIAGIQAVLSKGGVEQYIVDSLTSQMEELKTRYATIPTRSDTLSSTGPSGQISGTLTQDEIDRVRGVLRKRMGKLADRLNITDTLPGGVPLSQEGVMLPDGNVYINPAAIQEYRIGDNLIMSRDQRIEFVAWHEMRHAAEKHLSSRPFGAAKLDDLLSTARQNKVIDTLAKAIMSERSAASKATGLADIRVNERTATQEALAELSAAIRTGNYEALTTRYRDFYPPADASGIRKMVKDVADAIRKIVGKVTGKKYTEETLSNEDAINMMLEVEHQFYDTPLTQGVSSEVQNPISRAPQTLSQLSGFTYSTSPKQSFEETANRYGSEVAYNNAKSKGATHLTYQQWVQVRTPEFKAWFGDWEAEAQHSLGVDPITKEPRIFYHGTNADFDVFDYKYAGRKGQVEGRGFYFSPSKSVAEGYSGTGKILEVFLDFRNPVGKRRKITAGVLRNFIRKSIENNADAFSNYGDIGVLGPEGLTRTVMEHMKYNKTDIDIIGELFGNLEFDTYAEEMRAISDFFELDSVVVDDPSKEAMVVVFNPTQIKSATSNDGSFSSEEASILYSTPPSDPSIVSPNSIDLWHGSKYDGLEETGFDFSKIGTGAGGQNYGWGIYLTDTKTFAKDYPTYTSATLKIGDDVFQWNRTLNKYLRYSDRKPMEEVITDQDIINASHELNRQTIARSENPRISAKKQLQADGLPSDAVDNILMIRHDHLYNIKLDGDLSFLDFGARLSEQPKVWQAIQNLRGELPEEGREPLDKITPATRGDKAYSLIRQYGRSLRGDELIAAGGPGETFRNAHAGEIWASEQLLRHGVSGNKFNPLSSPSVNNFVIWDEAALGDANIRKLYSIPPGYASIIEAPYTFNQIRDPEIYIPDEVYLELLDNLSFIETIVQRSDFPLHVLKDYFPRAPEFHLESILQVLEYNHRMKFVLDYLSYADLYVAMRYVRDFETAAEIASRNPSAMSSLDYNRHITREEQLNYFLQRDAEREAAGQESEDGFSKDFEDEKDPIELILADIDSDESKAIPEYLTVEDFVIALERAQDLETIKKILSRKPSAISGLIFNRAISGEQFIELLPYLKAADTGEAADFITDDNVPIEVRLRALAYAPKGTPGQALRIFDRRGLLTPENFPPEVFARFDSWSYNAMYYPGEDSILFEKAYTDVALDNYFKNSAANSSDYIVEIMLSKPASEILGWIKRGDEELNKTIYLSLNQESRVWNESELVELHEAISEHGGIPSTIPMSYPLVRALVNTGRFDLIKGPGYITFMIHSPNENLKLKAFEEGMKYHKEVAFINSALSIGLPWNAITKNAYEGVQRFRREMIPVMRELESNPAPTLQGTARNIGWTKQRLESLLTKAVGKDVVDSWRADNGRVDTSVLQKAFDAGEYTIVGAFSREGIQSIGGTDTAIIMDNPSIDWHGYPTIMGIVATSGHPPGFAFALYHDFTDTDGQKAAVITEVQSDIMSMLFDKDKYEALKNVAGIDDADDMTNAPDADDIDNAPDAVSTNLEPLKAQAEAFKKTWPRAVMRNAMRHLFNNGYERVYALTHNGVKTLGANPPLSVINDTVGSKAAAEEGFGPAIEMKMKDGNTYEMWGAIEKDSDTARDILYSTGPSRYLPGVNNGTYIPTVNTLQPDDLPPNGYKDVWRRNEEGFYIDQPEVYITEEDFRWLLDETDHIEEAVNRADFPIEVAADFLNSPGDRKAKVVWALTKAGKLDNVVPHLNRPTLLYITGYMLDAVPSDSILNRPEYSEAAIRDYFDSEPARPASGYIQSVLAKKPVDEVIKLLKQNRKKWNAARTIEEAITSPDNTWDLNGRARVYAHLIDYGIVSDHGMGRKQFSKLFKQSVRERDPGTLSILGFENEGLSAEQLREVLYSVDPKKYEVPPGYDHVLTDVDDLYGARDLRAYIPEEVYHKIMDKNGINFLPLSRPDFPVSMVIRVINEASEGTRWSQITRMLEHNNFLDELDELVPHLTDEALIDAAEFISDIHILNEVLKRNPKAIGGAARNTFIDGGGFISLIPYLKYASGWTLRQFIENAPPLVGVEAIKYLPRGDLIKSIEKLFEVLTPETLPIEEFLKFDLSNLSKVPKDSLLDSEEYREASIEKYIKAGETKLSIYNRNTLIGMSPEKVVTYLPRLRKSAVLKFFHFGSRGRGQQYVKLLPYVPEGTSGDVLVLPDIAEHLTPETLPIPLFLKFDMDDVTELSLVDAPLLNTAEYRRASLIKALENRSAHEGLSVYDYNSLELLSPDMLETHLEGFTNNELLKYFIEWPEFEESFKKVLTLDRFLKMDFNNLKNNFIVEGSFLDSEEYRNAAIDKYLEDPGEPGTYIQESFARLPLERLVQLYDSKTDDAVRASIQRVFRTPFRLEPVKRLIDEGRIDILGTDLLKTYLEKEPDHDLKLKAFNEIVERGTEVNFMASAMRFSGLPWNKLTQNAQKGVQRFRRELRPVLDEISKQDAPTLQSVARGLGWQKEKLEALLAKAVGKEAVSGWRTNNGKIDRAALHEAFDMGEYNIIGVFKRYGAQTIDRYDYSIIMDNPNVDWTDSKKMYNIIAGSNHPPGFAFALYHDFKDADGQKAAIITEVQSDIMSLLFDNDKYEKLTEFPDTLAKIEPIKAQAEAFKKTWPRAVMRNAMRHLFESGYTRVYALTHNGVKALGANPPLSVINDTVGPKAAAEEGFGPAITKSFGLHNFEMWDAIEAGSPAAQDILFSTGPAWRERQRSIGIEEPSIALYSTGPERRRISRLNEDQLFEYLKTASESDAREALPYFHKLYGGIHVRYLNKYFSDEFLLEALPYYGPNVDLDDFLDQGIGRKLTTENFPVSFVRRFEVVYMDSRPVKGTIFERPEYKRAIMDRFLDNPGLLDITETSYIVDLFSELSLDELNSLAAENKGDPRISPMLRYLIRVKGGTVPSISYEPLRETENSEWANKIKPRDTQTLSYRKVDKDLPLMATHSLTLAKLKKLDEDFDGKAPSISIALRRAYEAKVSGYGDITLYIPNSLIGDVVFPFDGWTPTIGRLNRDNQTRGILISKDTTNIHEILLDYLRGPTYAEVYRMGELLYPNIRQTLYDDTKRGGTILSVYMTYLRQKLGANLLLNGEPIVEIFDEMPSKINMPLSVAVKALNKYIEDGVVDTSMFNDIYNPRLLSKVFDITLETISRIRPNYMEYKSLDVVDLKSIPAALVPTKLANQVRPILDKYGVEVFEYSKTPADLRKTGVPRLKDQQDKVIEKYRDTILYSHAPSWELKDTPTTRPGLASRLMKYVRSPEFADKWADRQGELDRIMKADPNATPVRHAFKTYNARVQHQLEKEIEPRFHQLSDALVEYYNQVKDLPVYKALKKSRSQELFLEHLDKIGKYVYHGRERNIEIAVRTNGEDFAGSGRNEAEIVEVENFFKAPERGSGQLLRIYEEIYRDHLKPLMDYSDEVLRRTGLLPPEMESARPKYKWYIPLYGKPELEDPSTDQNILDSYTSRGGATQRDVLQNKHHTAGGRHGTEAHSLFETVFTQAEIAVRRAQMQGAKKELWDYLQTPLGQQLFEAHIRTLSAGPTQDQTVDEQGQLTWTKALSPGANDIVYQNNNELRIMAIGNPRALSAIKDFNKAVITNNVEKSANWATRFMGSMYTRFNPSFIVKNKFMDSLQQWQLLLADAPTGSQLNTSGALGHIPAAVNVASRIPLALKAMGYNIAWTGTAGQSSDYKQWLDRYAELGGVTTYAKFLGRDQLLSLQQEFYDKSTGVVRFANPKNQITALGKLADGINNVLELTTRVSAFRALVESGVSDVTAANYVKDIMNFETKGEFAIHANSIWPFFTTSLYDVRRIGKALSKKEGQVVFLALVGASYALWEMLAQVGGDDEDGIPWVDKYPMGIAARHFIVPMLSDDGEQRGEGVRLPIGYGLGRLANSLALSMRRLANGTDDGGNFVSNIVNHSLIGSFSPLQPSDVSISNDPGMWLLNTFAPQVVKPVIQFGANKNWRGSPIYDSGIFRADGDLDYNSGFSWTADTYKIISEKIYDATGGDIAPESLQFWVQTAIGGLGSDVVSMVEMIVDQQGLGNATTASWYKGFPVLGGFVQTAPSEDRERYYTYRDRVHDKYNRLVDAAKRGRDVGEHRVALQWDRQFEITDKQLAKLRKQKKAAREVLKGEELRAAERRINAIEKMIQTNIIRQYEEQTGERK